MQTKLFTSSAIIKTLVYANVFIAICAMAQVLVTYLVFKIPFDVKNGSYILFVVLSTFLQYNIQRGYMINSNNQYTERSQWLAKHKKTLLISIVPCLIIVLFLCKYISYTAMYILGGAEIISTLYYLPPFNLRKHGYVKPFLISGVWVVSCAVVPLYENHVLTLNSVWFLVSQCFFITALCLLFDVKDAEEDYMNGINTYPNKFGLTFTKALTIFFVIVSFICSLFFTSNYLLMLITSAITSIITITTTMFTTDKKQAFYYYLWVDGLLIVQGLITIIVCKLR